MQVVENRYLYSKEYLRYLDSFEDEEPMSQDDYEATAAEWCSGD